MCSLAPIGGWEENDQIQHLHRFTSLRNVSFLCASLSLFCSDLCLNDLFKRFGKRLAFMPNFGKPYVMTSKGADLADRNQMRRETLLTDLTEVLKLICPNWQSTLGVLGCVRKWSPRNHPHRLQRFLQGKPPYRASRTREWNVQATPAFKFDQHSKTRDAKATARMFLFGLGLNNFDGVIIAATTIHQPVMAITGRQSSKNLKGFIPADDEPLMSWFTVYACGCSQTWPNCSFVFFVGWLRETPNRLHQSLDWWESWRRASHPSEFGSTQFTL